MASGGAIVTVFAVGYAVPDVPVFVIPALLCLWLFAAAGCEQALPSAGATACRRPRSARRRRPSASRRWPCRSGSRGSTPPASIAAAIGRTRSRCERLFEVLPPRIGASCPATSSPIACCSTSGGAATRPGRARSASCRASRRRCARSWRRRRRSSPSRRRSIASASRASTSRRRRWRSSTDRSADLVARLPRGAVVALAVPAVHAPRFAPHRRTGAPPAGRRRSARPAATSRWSAWSATRRRRVWPIAPAGPASPCRPATASGATGAASWSWWRRPAPRRSAWGAAIWCGPAPASRSRRGGRTASCCDRVALQAVDGYLVPGARRPVLGLSAARRSRTDRRWPPNAWVDVTPSTASGSVIVRIPAGGRLELYASDDARLPPKVRGPRRARPGRRDGVRDAARRRARSGRADAPGLRVGRVARPRRLHVACRRPPPPTARRSRCS